MYGVAVKPLIVAAASLCPSRSKDVARITKRAQHEGETAGVVMVADRQAKVVEGVYGVADEIRQAIDTFPARCDSICRLPLSRAMVKPRWKLSYAAAGSTSRRA